MAAALGGKRVKKCMRYEQQSVLTVFRNVIMLVEEKLSRPEMQSEEK